MIYSHRSLLALALLLTLFSGYAQAQQDKNTPSKEEIAALREKAFKLLESVASQLNTLQSAENRARMASNLVDSLWQHDETRARALIRLVQEDINGELRKERPRPFEDTTLRVFLKLRSDTAERIAKYDAEAALEFLKTTEPDPEKVPPDVVYSDQTIELQLAKKVAADKPEVALKLARQALDKRISTEVLMLLAKLNRKHKAQAQILYKEIVEKIRATDPRDDWGAREGAQTLVQGFKPPDADEATYRELVGFIVTKALEHGCSKKVSDEDEAAEFCQWVTSTLRGDAAKIDSRASRLKQWPIYEEGDYSYAFAMDEINDLVEEGAMDQLEAIASKRPELQDLIASRAIEQAMQSGKYEEAGKYVDRFVTDAETKKEMREHLVNQQKFVEGYFANLEEAKKEIEANPDTRLRVVQLMMMSGVAASKDRDAGLKLLDQANGVVDAMDPGKEQAQFRISLASMYCMQKSDRGFAMMEALVPKLNELVELAVKMDGYDTSYLRDGEWNMSANGSIGAILTQLSQDAGYFAWSDFDRAVSLASQFERPEIRLMAQLKLAQGALAPPNSKTGYNLTYTTQSFVLR